MVVDELFESRKKFLENFIGFIESRDKATFSISLDADWGYGKTFFIEKLKSVLENRGYYVLNFNAWANDIESDAFIGIMNEFLAQLKSSDSEKIAEFRESVVDCIGVFFQTVLFNSSKINGFIDDFKSNRDKARSRSDNHVYATDIVPSAVDLRKIPNLHRVGKNLPSCHSRSSFVECL